MTTLADIRSTAVRGAKALKEAACRNRPRDIKAVIDAYRGDHLVAQVVPDLHDRDLILKVFRACAIGFDADALAVTFEAYTTSVLPDGVDMTELLHDEELRRRFTINPVTGRPWEQGEMADVVSNHQGIEKGWVFESLTVLCANRAGDFDMTCLPYRYAGGHHVVWLNATEQPMEALPGGVMTDYMIAAMQEVSISTLVPHAPGEEGRAERDVTSANLMMKTFPCQVALHAEGSQRDRVRLLRQHGIVFHS